MVAVTRRKDGRYVAKLTIDGRRHCVYGRSEAEVRSKLEELERQLLLGQPPAPGRRTTTASYWTHSSSPASAGCG